jgi:hypothetical protein
VTNLLRADDRWVEFLIPCTIIVTAVINLFERDFKPGSLRLNYFLALFFGLIHGLGFANAIRFMLAKDQSLGWGLFGFNIGLEAGQVVVVTGVLLLSFLVVNTAGLKRQWWVWIISTVALGIAFKMVWERFPALLS